MAQVMVEGDDVCGVRAAQFSKNAEIVELASEFAKGFVDEVRAGERTTKRHARAETCLAQARLRGAAGDGDAVQLAPADFGFVEAISNGRSRNAFDEAGPRELAFFHSRDDFAPRQERRSRVVGHAGDAEYVHVRCFLSSPRGCNKRIARVPPPRRDPSTPFRARGLRGKGQERGTSFRMTDLNPSQDVRTGHASEGRECREGQGAAGEGKRSRAPSRLRRANSG